MRDRSAAPEVALAWVDLERYDLVGAARHLRLATVSNGFMGDRVPETMLGITRSRVQAARGDVKGAMSIVEKTSADIGDGNELADGAAAARGPAAAVARGHRRCRLEVEVSSRPSRLRPR